MTTIISVGGSIIAPNEPDVEFLKKFRELVNKLCSEDRGTKFVLVSGGGAPARMYQTAYRAICPGADNGEADWVGVMATRLNAELLRAVMGGLCANPVVTDPSAVNPDCMKNSQVLVAAGWKPGFSSDFDAVVLAEKFGAKRVINLSNIEKVYTDDPRKNPDAKPIDKISWKDFRTMVGDDWTPGKNTPFDPVASKRAEELGLEVVCAAGKNLPNLEAILKGRPFIGTLIG
jgi:uridylate kinase